MPTATLTPSDTSATHLGPQLVPGAGPKPATATRASIVSGGEEVRAGTLLQSARSGDAGAWRALVDRYSPMLWNIARGFRLDHATCADVVQTTWLTLVRRHESIADAQAVASWMTTTARREAWRVSRSDGRATPVVDEVIEARIPHPQAVEIDVVQIDEKDRLWACVNKLDARCRRLLRIVAFDDRPDYQGIARDLDMPVGSIGPTQGRCLGKLKTLLGEKSGADDE